MLLVDITIFASCLFSFWLRKKTYHYHNLPLLFAAKESGMLGIPLYLTLFGSAHLFRMGVLDVAQSFIAIPVIALLSADTDENTSVPEIAGAVIRSPLLLASMIGLTLNLSGGLQWLNGIGIGPVLTDTTGFLAQPVSAAVPFSVGYNFSLDRQGRGAIFRIAGLHIAVFAVFGIVMQLGLSLAAAVDVHTRWAMLLYSMLPASYLAPGFGHNQEEYTVSAGVCSLLTVVCLVAFCVIAIVAL